MNIADTVAQLTLSRTLVTQAVEDLKIFIASDTATIEERWDAYLLIEGDLPSCDSFDLRELEKDLGKNPNSMCYYDDFSMERKQNKLLSELAMEFMEQSCEDNPEYKEVEKQFCEDHSVKYFFQTEDRQIGKEWRAEQIRIYGDKLPLFREAILQSGLGSTQDDH